MLRFTFILFACLAGLLGLDSLSAAAQKPASPVVSRSYKIAVGDLLFVSASGIPEIGQREVAVAPDGRISVPLIGQLPVVGLTLTQLEEKLKKGVSKYYLRPNIGVSLISVDKERFSNKDRFINVIGPAERSNKIPMKDGWRILDALAAAGGVPTDRLEFYKIQLVREDVKTPLDMKKLIQDQDPAQNLSLKEGDTLFITAIDESQRAVTVFGQVQKTGPILLPSDGSIATVVSLAGGFTPAADRAQSYIERNNQKLPVDLTKLDQGEVKERLQIGDKLFIPENRKRYRVVGAVNEPGEKLYPDDRKLMLSEVLTNAKIPVQGANLKKVHLTRANSGAASVVQTLNVEKMMKDGDPTGDVEVLPGDVITVDASKQSGTGLQAIQNGVFILSGLVGVLAFFRR